MNWTPKPGEIVIVQAANCSPRRFQVDGEAGGHIERAFEGRWTSGPDRRPACVLLRHMRVA